KSESRRHVRGTGVIAQEQSRISEQILDFRQRGSREGAVFAKDGEILTRAGDEYGLDVELRGHGEESLGGPSLAGQRGDGVNHGVRRGVRSLDCGKPGARNVDLPRAEIKNRGCQVLGRVDRAVN